MSERFQPLPEWATGHRMAALEDPELTLVSTGQPADYVTSWTGRTEEFRTLADGTRPLGDLDRQPEQIHRPVLELAPSAEVDEVAEILDDHLGLGGWDGQLTLRVVANRGQVFADVELPTGKYLALLETLDKLGLLAEGVLEGAYADGFTVAALRGDTTLERPGVEEV